MSLILEKIWIKNLVKMKKKMNNVKKDLSNMKKEILSIEEYSSNTSMHLHLDYTSDILCFPRNRSSRMAASHERERERKKEKKYRTSLR